MSCPMSTPPNTESVGETVTATLRQAGSAAARALDTAQTEVRRHREEMLYLGATLLFVLVVGAIALPAVF